jgi:hypothetical protein
MTRRQICLCTWGASASIWWMPPISG